MSDRLATTILATVARSIDVTIRQGYSVDPIVVGITAYVLLPDGTEDTLSAFEPHPASSDPEYLALRIEKIRTEMLAEIQEAGGLILNQQDGTFRSPTTNAVVSSAYEGA